MINPTHTALAIATVGNPVLRQTAQEIQDVHDPNLQGLIGQLLLLMRNSNGVGIAAPQVGVSQRLLIVASRPTERYPHAPQMAPITMLNPRLLEVSADRASDWEGCLSVPGMRGKVPRARWVVVEYLDQRGRLQQREFQDFLARIFQHELDHLEGHVFLDRVISTTDLMVEQEYRQQILGQVAPAP